MGGHVDVHGTLLGNITGLLLATTNIPEYIRGGFPVLVWCLRGIESMNPSQTARERKKPALMRASMFSNYAEGCTFSWPDPGIREYCIR